MHRSRIRLTRARGVVGKPQPAPARVAFATVDRQRFQSLGPWRGSPAMRRVRQRAEQTARTCRARKAMQRRCVEAGRWQRFDVAWPLARLAGKAASAAEGRSNRENRGARNPMQRGCADRPASPSDPLRQFRYHPPGGLWASANRRSFSRSTSARWCSNSASKANSPQNQRAGTKNRVLLEGDRLEIEVKGGRWVLTHLPAKRAAPKPVRHYFPDD